MQLRATQSKRFTVTLKQLTLANSAWAYIREGLLSKGYLHLRFGGLIFGRAYGIYLFIFLWGGGGGEGVIIGILEYLLSDCY